MAAEKILGHLKQVHLTSLGPQSKGTHGLNVKAFCFVVQSHDFSAHLMTRWGLTSVLHMTS